MIDASDMTDLAEIARESKVAACRRALAVLYQHHGSRPLERGCSAEARRIRAHMTGIGLPRALFETAPANAEAVILVTASAYGVTRAAMLQRRPHGTALLALQEAIYRCSVELGLSLSEIGLTFDRERSTIRSNIAAHAARLDPLIARPAAQIDA